MIAIFRNEVAMVYRSMLGYVYGAVFILVAGIFFVSFNLILGYNEFGYALSSTKMILIVLIPVLTMRTFSGERKQKTDSFLFTAPVTSVKIVLGKYMAVMAVFTVPLLLLAVCPLILRLYGYVDMLKTGGCFLAYFFLGAACCSVGLLISSAVSSPVLSAILTFALLVLSYMADTIGALVTRLPVLQTLVGGLALFQRYSDFVDGMFDITHLIYYICVTVTALCLTVLLLESRRWR